MIHLPTDRRHRLANTSCIYCGIAFGPDVDQDEEHVVGRKFVPKGSLAKQVNLVANTCRECNAAKSALENDISSITMQPGPDGHDGDEHLEREAQRKSTAISIRTGKIVRDSHESFEIEGSLFPGFTMKFGLVSGPQLDFERSALLAEYHVRAFFYMLSFDEEKGHGLWPLGPVCCLGVVCRNDWGNETLTGFTDQVRTWHKILQGTLADGYFKVAFYRCPDRLVWGWALEWNKRYRIFGCFGEDGPVSTFVEGLPKLQTHVVEKKSKCTTRARIEVPLAESSDVLFDCCDGKDH